jgi:hypothetical protein
MKKIIILILTIGLLVIGVIPTFAQGVYPAWHQGFEKNTNGWYGSDIPGEGGWCGEITRYSRGSGPVAPSVGGGYAVVSNGPCNDHWMNNGWPVSAPYAPFGGYSESFPQSGFVSELDIYLDPSWGEGSGFNYYVSMRMLDDGSFRYLLFPVEISNGTLMVAGNEASEAGWYTFRVKFRERDGYLAVNFELAQRGRLLFSQAVTSTAFYGDDPATYEVNNVGTGYSWFDSISEGLELPIDQHKYRPGK